jgi:hypothetical protein
MLIFIFAFNIPLNLDQQNHQSPSHFEQTKTGSEIETSNEIPVASHFQVPKQTRTKQPIITIRHATAPEYSRNEKTNKQGSGKALPISCRQW